MRAVRTPEAIQALIERLDAFDERARERGRDYLKDGAVAAVWSEADHLVKAEVVGNARYNLTWFFTRGKWTFQCSCPDKRDCKHAYASGYAWITAVETGAPDGRRDPRTIPHRLESNFTQAVTCCPRPRKRLTLPGTRFLPISMVSACASTTPATG